MADGASPFQKDGSACKGAYVHAAQYVDPRGAAPPGSKVVNKAQARSSQKRKGCPHMQQIKENIVFIGGGNMGSAILGGLRQQGVAAEQITVVAPG